MVMDKSKPKNNDSTSPHPWRMCPLGEHWVVPHPMVTPKGKLTTRRGHCARNPSHKDQMYFDEITEIQKQNFSKIKTNLPSDKGLGFSSGKKYDVEIAAWTKYWNEVFQPTKPLDPDVIKALVASESSFKKTQVTKNKNKKIGNARGLLQITDQTQKILSDSKGELKNHIINIPQNKMLDANANICVGIRWLFHKRDMATTKWKRNVSWREAIAEYKAYTDHLMKGKSAPGMKVFDSYFAKLKVPKK